MFGSRCGTGKNTEWLIQKASEVAAIDLSDEMLSWAKSKIVSDKVKFIQADITQDRSFTNENILFDLVSFSLILEHIENLEPIFGKASESLRSGGYVYVGETSSFQTIFRNQG